ncbi:3-methyl-2-oxobutanoate hydroxymethyltransferase [Paraliomyxa miuraensis]|uniref:3-methyl-2-oxobutanoate hydroxymethyltransferase n=1 Tax=Paraliomyxa miuraensis TaxID=376150 RepID=UPI0022565255|nr:3-methyl-2-oxobutanoate hydroxymethyltransferase [Paraliomyxa miuraensis]MCX4239965.1 3-methyl-2-oxobutanoate hydroxymethyltransferase [Paraliomyxa miuraensis]
MSHDDRNDASYGRAVPGPGSKPPLRKAVTVPTIRAAKGREPLVMVTAYDATFARILDEAGADLLLVGDSLGMVIQGNDDTLSVTVDDIVYHCRAVARGAKSAHVVGDMPFLSYQVTPEEAVRNAGRILAQGRAHSVKLEGGRTIAPTIERMVAAGIPVMAHVGLTPQSVHAMGGFRVQGRDHDDAERILADAHAVAEAGAYALVLEGIPGELAARITAEVSIPTIGIGAGVQCDGQVLVCYDLLGLTADLRPRFVKRYEELYDRSVAAVRAYCDEVRTRRFPAPEHTFGARKGPRAIASTG